MLTKDKLPHILNLIDDESEEIKNYIFKDLSEYGPDLEADLLEFTDVLNMNNLSAIKPIIEENRRNWLKANWNEWTKGNTELEKVEIAMNLISKFQLGIAQQTSLTEKLNTVAENFMNHYPYGNELDLSNYLFNELDLKGNKKDYYNPLNSNLYYAFESGLGLPLTLVLIYMLVAERTGLTVVGCNFPGHFLAKIDIDGEMLLIDCFNRGKIIFESDLKELSGESFEALLKIINRPFSSRKIIKRVFANLITAYRDKNDTVNYKFFKEMLVLTSFAG